MTFESMIENSNVVPSAPAVVADNTEELALKVSYGNDIRRAAFNGTSCEGLRALVAALFALDQASVVLKYQDEDDDKITVSTDGELQDAIQLSKEKKILRLFVEIKAPVVAQEAPAENNAFVPPFFGHGRRFGGPFHGPFRGGFGGFGPHHGGPHGGPHGHHGGPHHGGPHGFGHHGGPHGFHHGRGHHGRGGFYGHFTPADSVYTTPVAATGENPAQPGEPTANYSSSHSFASGNFSPAGEHPFSWRGHRRGGPYAGPFMGGRHGFKEHKHELKQQFKLMKENATTPEERQAVKELKKQMCEEWKQSMCNKKWDKKWEKKCEKKWDKGEKKREKCEKWEKKKCEKWEKKNCRFTAKHVADVTIPDNSELPADTPVTKTWRLKNSGATAWPEDSYLIFISHKGDNLNGPERVFVGTVQPDQEVEVSISFITPSEPGRYIGYYRMASSDGSKFGQRVWVAFLIPPTATATSSTSTSTPTACVDVTMD